MTFPVYGPSELNEIPLWLMYEYISVNVLFRFGKKCYVLTSNYKKSDRCISSWYSRPALHVRMITKLESLFALLKKHLPVTRAPTAGCPSANSCPCSI